MKTFKMLEAGDSCHGEIMAKAEWLEHVSLGAFVPSDGHGFWAATDGKGHVFESEVDCFTDAPGWATLVTWYNK